MDRRTFVRTAAGAVLAKTFPANAQSSAKIPRIGVNSPSSPCNLLSSTSGLEKTERRVRVYSVEKLENALIAISCQA
jgi:hypothetical protein